MDNDIFEKGAVMKSIKGLLLILVVTISIWTFSIPVFAAKAKIDKKRVKLYEGATVQLQLTGVDGRVTWSSSNKKVAVVKNGIVTGKRKGTATITAKCGKLKAICKVTVKKIKGTYHTEKGNQTYSDYRKKNSPFSLDVDIVGNKLIIAGILYRYDVGETKAKRVKGKKHIFILSSKAKFYGGDRPITKKAFLKCTKQKKEWWEDTEIYIRMEDGKVVEAGTWVAHYL